MLKNTTSIYFALHRTNLGPTHDDTIGICQIDTDYYQITHTDKDSNQKSVFNLDEHSMLRYLQTMMDMLVADADPFEFFQTMIPGQPSILLKISQLNNPVIRSNIFSSVKTCLRHWPMSKRWRAQPAPTTVLAPSPDYSSRPPGAEPSFLNL